MKDEQDIFLILMFKCLPGHLPGHSPAGALGGERFFWLGMLNNMKK